VVDVESILSPQDEPMSATMVDEEDQDPMTTRMEIDP
jgi:hypothetical protein